MKHILLTVSITINIILVCVVCIHCVNKPVISTQDIRLKVIDKLMSIHNTDYYDLRIYKDIDNILANGTLYDTSNVLYYKEGVDGDCCNISLYLNKTYGFELHRGYACKGEVWSVHFWCMDNNTIVEPNNVVWDYYYGCKVHSTSIV